MVARNTIVSGFTLAYIICAHSLRDLRKELSSSSRNFKKVAMMGKAFFAFFTFFSCRIGRVFHLRFDFCLLSNSSICLASKQFFDNFNYTNLI